MTFFDFPDEKRSDEEKPPTEAQALARDLAKAWPIEGMGPLVICEAEPGVFDAHIYHGDHWHGVRVLEAITPDPIRELERLYRCTKRHLVAGTLKCAINADAP